MGLTEKEIYESFGLEVPADISEAEGEKEAKLTESPSESDKTNEGAKEQELTDPADAENEENNSLEADSDEIYENETGEEDAQSNVTDGTLEGKVAQTPSERAKHAAARRKAEVEAAVAKAKSEAEASAAKDFDMLLKLSNLKDPITGSLITTKAEFDESVPRFEEAKRRAALSKSGMTDEEYNSFVSSLPEVKEAREAAERARAERAKIRLEEDIKEIGKIDPAIKTLEDIASLPEYDNILGYVKKGLTIAEAYRLSVPDKRAAEREEKARQAEINKLQSKEHLSRTFGRGTGAVAVPKDVREAYRLFDPSMTDDEIAKHYSKHKK